MANRVYASPGVYTSEKDLTYSIETLGVTTLGAAGETVKGPAFQPIPVKNYDQFSTIFGGINPEKFRNTQIVKYELSYIAKNYLTQSNQLYVTRILGLSGYDKGDAFALKTIGSIDRDTLTGTTSSAIEVYFTGNTNSSTYYVSGTSTNLLTELGTQTNVATTKFADAYAAYFTKYTTATGTTKNFWKHDVFHWGLIPSGTTDLVTSGATSPENTSTYSNTAPLTRDAYVYPSGLPTIDQDNYYINTEFTYTGGTYYGRAFILTTDEVELGTGTTISGKVILYNVDYEASPVALYHNKLVATIRGKGLYVNDELEFLVSGSTVGIAPGLTGGDPYADFTITGSTITSTPFTYTVSLDTSKKNYIENVLGLTNFDKSTNLYVEDVYNSALAKGWLNGYVKGLYPELIHIPRGESGAWDHFKFQFQSPATPYFVSELRGGVAENLFRVISISDGDHANTEIKISIANVDLAKKTFDLYVRRFEDTDKTPVIIERYTNCSMNELSSRFIGRLVGTVDNKYTVNSSYILIEIAENAPSDAVPCGFDGYNFKTHSDLELGVPEITYKTKYFVPGEVWQSNPLGADLVSSGDKVRKTYLGFSDVDYGFDTDITKFQGRVNATGTLTYNTGNEWGEKTKGFHLDVNADADLFEVGVGQFTDSVVLATDIDEPYYDIRTRKFTAVLSGGFDAWDMYRESRTTTDLYRIGQSGFVNGDFATFANAEYDETFGSSDYYAFLYGYKTFQNPEKVNINILVTPGIDVINNNQLCQAVIEIVEEKRLDSIYIPTLPDIGLYNNTNSANTDDWYFPNDISEQMDNLNLDSNYTAVYYPWIQIADVENNAYLWIPPTAEVVRNLAYTDNVSFPWFATAGYNRGLVNCKRTRIVLDQESRDLLYPARINPIATFSDVGTVIWGNRNLQLRDSALNRLNIRRLLLQARKLIISVSNRLLFDPNDSAVRSQFLSLVNPILDNIRKERGLSDFRIKLDPVSDSDRNTMKGKIHLKPIDALEFIDLEFNITPTSVSFENI